ncbi:hypothetical protein FJZ26_02140 [Candidatus Parvarchaeota archaeon]|nr:hypothetical protein [Candidatus Parvarchaeota archaeon]
MESGIGHIRKVFGDRKSAGLFAVLCTVLLVVYLTLNSVIDPLRLALNSLAKPLDVALVVVLAIMAALFMTLLEYQHRQSGSVVGARGGTFGAIVGGLTTACPICLPLWTYYLGIGSVAASLAQASPYLLAASIIGLGYSIRRIAISGQEGCAIGKK